MYVKYNSVFETLTCIIWNGYWRIGSTIFVSRNSFHWFIFISLQYMGWDDTCKMIWPAYSGNWLNKRTGILLPDNESHELKWKLPLINLNSASIDTYSY